MKYCCFCVVQPWFLSVFKGTVRMKFSAQSCNKYTLWINAWLILAEVFPTSALNNSRPTDDLKIHKNHWKITLVFQYDRMHNLMIISYANNELGTPEQLICRKQFLESAIGTNDTNSKKRTSRTNVCFCNYAIFQWFLQFIGYSPNTKCAHQITESNLEVSIAIVHVLIVWVCTVIIQCCNFFHN